MIRLPDISCFTENHREMPYQFVCLDSLCQQNNTHLACLYCCQEFHQAHIDQIVPIKVILTQMSSKQSNKGFKLLSLLLQGIQTCSSFKELQSNLTEILAYRNNPHRFEELLDQEAQALQKKTQEYYQRAHRQQLKRQISIKERQLVKPCITPVLTFAAGSHTLNSPFSVTNPRNQLITAFAQPSLCKFDNSIEVTLKLDRYTPSWLALGLSLGQSKYQESSPKHILAISNGWLSNQGVLQRWKVKFGSGDCVKVRWDKEKQLVEFTSSKGERGSVGLERPWRQQIFLCVCLFYSGDSVRLM